MNIIHLNERLIYNISNHWNIRKIALACLGITIAVNGMAIGMAMAAALLGALSPVAIALQCPATPAAYPWVLLGHTAAVGACRTVGIARLMESNPA